MSSQGGDRGGVVMSTGSKDSEEPQKKRIQLEDAKDRQLPDRIDIPHIRGEMVYLRPAVIADLTAMDELEAFYNSTGITGKGPQAERAVVNAWVRRSVAWSKGLPTKDSGVGDPESRRTLAWAMMTDADHDQDGSPDAGRTAGVIGIIFLIDVDGWSRSARIQVVLGRDYRGRGYSRDAMPRVMTYGYAAMPTGLGLHRIWVAVPEKNTRSISVYQSLGFMISGTSRDALWDIENGKYQDQIVMDALADEYDPIQSLNAFGMHVIDGNPGVAQSLIDHGYTTEEGTGMTASEAQQYASRLRNGIVEEVGDSSTDRGEKKNHDSVSPSSEPGQGSASNVHADQGEGGLIAQSSDTLDVDNSSHADEQDTLPGEQGGSHDEKTGSKEVEEHDSSDWAYGSAKAKGSKRAWWRNLGHGRDRSSGGGQ